jgi:uncharacterized protein (DUF2126 family)
LSWLFSGLFIGPTSQAPRIDEARHDSLYELALAFKQMGAGNLARRRPGWWTGSSAILLIDSGNTHRAEFSALINFTARKRGRRLGLVEMRAFEMPPHARMSARPTIAAARSCFKILEAALQKRSCALGHGHPRPLDAAAFLRNGFQGCRADLRGPAIRLKPSGSRRI